MPLTRSFWRLFPSGSTRHPISLLGGQTLGLLWKRTSLSEVLEALHVGLDAPSSPLHVLETLLANSGHSNGLVRDLLPLPRAAVEAHLSRALLATVGSRLRTAGVWTVTLSRVMNFLFSAGWTERPVSLAHSVRLTPAQVRRRLDVKVMVQAGRCGNRAWAVRCYRRA